MSSVRGLRSTRTAGITRCKGNNLCLLDRPEMCITGVGLNVVLAVRRSQNERVCQGLI